MHTACTCFASIPLQLSPATSTSSVRKQASHREATGTRSNLLIFLARLKLDRSTNIGERISSSSRIRMSSALRWCADSLGLLAPVAAPSWIIRCQIGPRRMRLLRLIRTPFCSQPWNPWRPWVFLYLRERDEACSKLRVARLCGIGTYGHCITTVRDASLQLRRKR